MIYLCLQNFFHVNASANPVNSNVLVAMPQVRVLFVFHDHFNAMAIMIVLIVRTKSAVVRHSKALTRSSSVRLSF